MASSMTIFGLLAVLTLWGTPSVVSGDDAAILSCCTPDVWEGRQISSYTVTGKKGYSFVETRTAVSYDATNEREALYAVGTNDKGDTTRLNSISFYSDRVGYIYNPDTNECTTIKLTNFRGRCVPAGAQLQDSGLTMGVDPNSLVATRVTYGSSTILSKSSGQLVLTEQCIPIYDSLWTSAFGAFSILTNKYENIVPGIASEDVFDVPPACFSRNAKRLSQEFTPEQQRRLSMQLLQSF